MSYNNEDLPRIFDGISPGSVGDPNPDVTEPFTFDDPLSARKGLPSDVKRHVSEADIITYISMLERRPAFFCEQLLYIDGKSMKITPKQLELWDAFTNSQFAVGVFNRQGGKSRLVGAYDTYELMFAPNEDHTIIFAPILGQTQIIYGITHGNVKGNQLISSFMETDTKTMLIAKNGNKINTLSASENAHVRGHSPNKIQFDETQDITDRKYYEDILPSGAATNAKVQETGTPKGRNHFYDTVKNNPRYRIVTQKWWECPFLSEEYVETFRHQMTEAQFKQEFECVWNLDIGAVWAYTLLLGIEGETPGIIVPTLELKDPEKLGACYAGIDIGKKPAETVLSVYEYIDDEFVQVFLERYGVEMGQTTYDLIMDELESDIDTYAPVYAAYDATGAGDSFVDIFESRVGEKYAMEKVTYNQPLKNSMVDHFTLIAERNKVKMLPDPEQRRQMVGWDQKRGANGLFKFKASDGGRDDIPNANILALWAANLMDATGTSSINALVGQQMHSSASSAELNRRLGGSIERPVW